MHGALLNAYMTALCGTQLPGPGAVLLTQTLRYLHPVRVDRDAFTARVRVTHVDARRPIVTVATPCYVQDTLVMDGTASMLIPRPTWRLARHHAPPHGL